MALQTTSTATEGWRPNVVSKFDPDDVVRPSLIMQIASKAGDIEGDAPTVLVPYVSVDPTAEIVAEGAALTPNEGTMSQVALSTYKVGVVSRFSRELLTQPGAADRIAKSMSRAVIAKADAAFLSNPASPAGILVLPGTGTGGTIGAAGLFDIYGAVAQIEADGGTATHVLVNPLDWALLASVPTQTGSNVSALADAYGPKRTLAGLPAIVHPLVPEGTALVSDQSEIVAAYGSVELARSEHLYFLQDAIAIRATWRIGWGLVRPARVVKLTVA